MPYEKMKIIFFNYNEEKPGRRKKEQRILIFLAMTLVLVQTACRRPGIPRIQFNEPPLKLGTVNILTTQLNNPNVLCENGTLTLWEYAGGTYRTVWKAETYNYRSVAIGDIDGDGKREIVGLGRCPYNERAAGREQSYNAYFLEAYKEETSPDRSGRRVWKSTFGGDPESVVPDDYRWMISPGVEMTLADMDGDRIREIVFITDQWLAVYKYDPFAEDRVRRTPGALIKIAAVRPDVENHLLCLRSVTVRDIDGDGENEILVSANVGLQPHWHTELAAPGYVLIYRLRHGSLELTSYLSVDAILSNIRCGDLDHDGKPELCSMGYKTSGKRNQAYVFIWDEVDDRPSVPQARRDSDRIAVGEGQRVTSMWRRHDILFGKPDEGIPYFSLEVGELDEKHPGDEIVLALSSFLQLTVCYWRGKTNIYSLQDVFFEDAISSIYGSVTIADVDGDGKNEIIFAGGRKVRPDSGWYFLEIRDGNLREKWSRRGGEFGELFIICAAVG